jgi:hypothetical protein
MSLVDIAKPYNYLYDVIHDRLNKNLASSWGVKAPLDFALIPDGWNMDKWLYYAKTTPFYIKDSFKEGNKGAATGKLAGMLNNASGALNLDQSGMITQDINLLQFIKNEMSDVLGITPQREGTIAARETVGGVERSVVQSSNITEWYFTIHDNLKKRVCECFLETAKTAFRGQTIKFPYIMHDGYEKMLEIDGDEFSECDYGLVVDNTRDTELFLQKIEGYAQALIQNSQISLETLVKIWNKSSVNDIVKSIEYEVQKKTEEAIEAGQRQQQQFQAELQAKAEIEDRKMQLEEMKVAQQAENNIRDNETQLTIAGMKTDTMKELQSIAEYDKDNEIKDKELQEKKRQFDENLALRREAMRKTG